MDVTHPLELAQQRGAALLDNTTVTGATAALEQPTEASIADEQSLADLLEAVVLHESLIIDSWADTELYPSVLLDASSFATFPSVTATPAGGIYAEGDTGLLEFTTHLVHEALDRLERSLRSEDRLGRQHELLMEQLGVDQNFSPFYARELDLRQEIIALYRTETYKLPPDLEADEAAFGRILTLEAAISKALNGAPEGRKRYAMFLLRAFYYEELAAAFSISYVPHTFRAQALLALPPVRGGPSTREFDTIIKDSATRTRNELGKQVGFDVTIDIPPIAARIARDVESRARLLPAALELRESESARDFRGWARDQALLLRRQADLPATKKAKQELDELVANLRVELLGATREGGHPVTIKGRVGFEPFAGVEISSDGTIRSPSWLRRGPSWLQRALGRQRPYLTFFSQLARDQVSGKVAPFSVRLRELPP